jgi:hypothetical protein
MPISPLMLPVTKVIGPTFERALMTTAD